MNFKRYALTLFLVPVLFFSAKSYAQNITSDTLDEAPKAVLPFVLEDVGQDGGVIEVSGTSRFQKLVDIINDLDVTLYPEDKVSVFPDLYMQMGGKITLTRAPKINLTDGKKKALYRSWSGTVQELLAEKNIAFGADDKVSPALDSSIRDGSEIIINRVAKTTITENEDIAFKILNKDDPNLAYGKTRIQAGSKGSKELEYLVTRVDGDEVSRVLLESNIVTPAKDEIHFTGTKVTVISSVRGRATMTPVSGYIVSARYPKGTLIRISANGVSMIVTVTATWGTASPPDGIIMDLAPNFLVKLKCPSSGCSNLLEEEIQQ